MARKAAPAAVLTHRFWSTTLDSDPVGHRQDDQARRPRGHHRRRARAVDSLSGGDRDHRERGDEPAPPGRDDGGWAGASHDRALRPAGAGRRPRIRARRAARRARRHADGAPEDYPPKDDYRIDAVQLRDQITSPARTVLLVLLAASGLIFVIACSNVANLILARSVRREGELAIRAALGAGRRRAAPDAAGREPAALRRRRSARRRHRPADGRRPGALRVALLGARARPHGGCEPAVGGREPRAGLRGAPRVRAAAAVRRGGERPRPVDRQRPDHLRHEPPAAAVRGHADRRVVRAAGGRRHADHDADRAAANAARHEHAQRPGAARAGQLRAAAGADRCPSTGK